MAASEEGTLLTEQHRVAQGDLRSRALSDFLLLWPLWTGDQESFANLVLASMPLVSVYQQLSATLAGTYYEAFRTAESVKGAADVKLAAAMNPDQVAASMYVTGDVATRDALQGGQTPESARQTAFVRTSGAVTRHVLSGGRNTILDTVAADKQALGWARVTDGDPCYFCLTLASRGAVYKSEQSASFQAHDHCACTAEPVFHRSQLPPLTKKWRSIYNQAQNEAEASGELQPGENSSSARLNAVRRFLAAK